MSPIWNYDEDSVRDYRDLGHGEAAWDEGRRYDNGDDARNQRRNRLEKLPTWARAIEERFWGEPMKGGGL